MYEKQYENPGGGGEGGPAPKQDELEGVQPGSSRYCLGFRLLGLAVHLPDDLVDVDDLVGVLLQHLLRGQAGTVASVTVTQTDCRLHIGGVE